jgi:hypothetical protein
MKISYALTVKDELIEIKRLIDFLLENIRQEDEIVVLYDSKNGSKGVEDYLRAQNVEKTKFLWYPYEFDGHFANLKNYLTTLCSKDFIFQIDADEVPNATLIQYLPQMLEINWNVDVLRVPRVNTVEGLTQEHIQKWRWNVNEKGWVNWPDPQWRIYKNNGKIKWKNKVHEVLEGYSTMAVLPLEEEFALYHPKDIERQEKQNAYYNTL